LLADLDNTEEAMAQVAQRPPISAPQRKIRRSGPGECPQTNLYVRQNAAAALAGMKPIPPDAIADFNAGTQIGGRIGKAPGENSFSRYRSDDSCRP
jgi:hypothetical protein